MAAAEIPLVAVVNAAGSAVVTVTPTNRQTWTVQQISPEMPSAPANSTGVVRKNGSLVAPFEPTGDAVGGEPYVTLRLGDRLTVEWANCTPGDLGKAFIMYDDGVTS